MTFNVSTDNDMNNANNNCSPGDIILISNGTYGVAPNPGKDGTSTKRITYIGNLTTPMSVSVLPPWNNTLPRAKWWYVTWKGMHMRGSLYLEGDVNHYGDPNGWLRGDSLCWCDLQGGSGMGAAGNCVMTNNTIGYNTPNASFSVSSPYLGMYSPNPTGNIITDNNILLHSQDDFDNLCDFITTDFTAPTEGTVLRRNHIVAITTGTSCS